MLATDKIIDYNRTESQLEEWLIFNVCLSGKSPSLMAEKTNRFIWKSRSLIGEHKRKGHEGLLFLRTMPKSLTGLQCLSWIFCMEEFDGIDHIDNLLKSVRMGKYNILTNMFRKITEDYIQDKVDLNTITVESLQRYPGISPKTARIFVINSRRNQRYVSLNSHILKFLNGEGVKAPKSTPSSSKRYAELEKEFLKISDTRGVSPLELYLSIGGTGEKGVSYGVS